MVSSIRKFIRHPSDIPIELVPVGEGKADNKTLNNVSVGGLSCASNIYLPEGTLICVRINCIDPDFEMVGKVKWCRMDDGRYNIGVGFDTKEQDMFKLRMVEQICQVEHYRRKVLNNERRVISSEQAAHEWVAKHASDFPE